MFSELSSLFSCASIASSEASIRVSSSSSKRKHSRISSMFVKLLKSLDKREAPFVVDSDALISVEVFKTDGIKFVQLQRAEIQKVCTPSMVLSRKTQIY